MIKPPFNKLLVANRGEIACRVMRTAQAMGIATVAVYSDADTAAPHVLIADEAVHIGPPPSRDSYLQVDRVIQAAIETGAEAIHPGYGFLSENAGFVSAVQDAGLTFVGPDVHAIKVMGDKIESKSLAKSAGVSCVPGTDGAVSDIDEAMAAAEAIGYPVMVKASAGGGGKGMRVIDTAADMADGMRAAMNEARNAFGDDRVFIEKFVVKPRHIEIQILADKQGHAIYLGERECSVQRRHQKVIEEAPSSFISEETRCAMGEQAVALAKAVSYRSAGTVEFIVGANQDFYFLEMNTRLQVEHPVTEEVYGLDLVEMMLRVAAGEQLPLKQADIKPKGWSIEARLYAEDSARGFLPSTGQLLRYRAPQGEGVRTDSGVAEGGMISMFYDPMIAKLVATAPTRPEAIDRLRLALDHYQVAGVATNRQFLCSILSDADFRKGDINTGFIAEKYGNAYVADAPEETACENLAALALCVYGRGQDRLRYDDNSQSDFVAVLSGKDAPVRLNWTRGGGADQVVVNGSRSVRVTGTLDQPLYRTGVLFDGTIDEIPVAIQIDTDDHHFTLHAGAHTLSLRLYPAHAAAYIKHMPETQTGLPDNVVVAPMPGLLTAVLVVAGERVEQGQDVAIIEAMKMENVLQAGMSGKIGMIEVATGANLNVDDVILTITPDE